MTNGISGQQRSVAKNFTAAKLPRRKRLYQLAGTLTCLRRIAIVGSLVTIFGARLALALPVLTATLEPVARPNCAIGKNNGEKIAINARATHP